MSEIKHIGAMTLGIIGTNLSDRNEKIKEILESDTPIIKVQMENHKKSLEEELRNI